MSVATRLAKRAGKNRGHIKHLGKQRDWTNYRDLLIVLVQKELKVRYNHKLLGYLWSIANPLAHSMIYFLAFRVFMRVHIDNYTLVLISGLFPWQWISNSIGGATSLFVGNAAIIKKVDFPRYIVVLADDLNHMIHFVASIPVIMLFLFLFKEAPTIHWLYGFPILLVLQFITAFSLSLTIATLNVFLRDLERLTSILLHFVFYVTPILFPLNQIPAGYKKYIFLNPLAPLMVSWRELILEGQLEPRYLAYSAIYAVLFFAIGAFLYRKLEWRFAEVI